MPHACPPPPNPYRPPTVGTVHLGRRRPTSVLSKLLIKQQSTRRHKSTYCLGAFLLHCTALHHCNKQRRHVLIFHFYTILSFARLASCSIISCLLTTHPLLVQASGFLPTRLARTRRAYSASRARLAVANPLPQSRSDPKHQQFPK